MRRTGTGIGLAAVAPTTRAASGRGCGRPASTPARQAVPWPGSGAIPACVEDYIFRSCEGIAPGAWSPGDCAGPPPEVLGCLEP